MALLPLMSKVALVVVFLFGLLSQTRGVLLEPSSITAQVYTVHTLRCNGTGTKLFWNIDGGSLTNHAMEERSISRSDDGTVGSNQISTLTIRALPINDGIDFGCSILTTDSNLDQLGARFSIKGVPLNGLQFKRTQEAFNLIWSNPDVPSDYQAEIQHHVTVTNRDNVEVQKEVNITNRRQIQLSNLTLCDIYNVAVIAQSGSYSSETTVSAQYVQSQNVSIPSQHYHRYYNASKGTFNIVFPVKIEGTPHLCNSSIQGETNEMTARIKNHEEEPVKVFSDKEEETVNYTATGIAPDIKCNFTIKMFDLINKTNPLSEANATFYTTHVDNVNITHLGNGSVRVRCILVKGSDADGCRVVFNSTNHQFQFDIFATVLEENVRVIEGNVLLTDNGTYDMKAYDIVNGTDVHDVSYDYSEQVIVNIPPTSPPLASSNSVHRSSSIVLVTASSGSSSILLSSTIGTTPTVTPVSTVGTNKGGSPSVGLAVGIGIVAGILLMVVLLVVLMVGVVYIRKKKRSFILNRDRARCSKSRATNHDYVSHSSSDFPTDPPPQYDQVVVGRSGRVVFRESPTGEDPYHVHVTPPAYRGGTNRVAPVQPSPITNIRQGSIHSTTPLLMGDSPSPPIRSPPSNSPPSPITITTESSSCDSEEVPSPSSNSTGESLLEDPPSPPPVPPHPTSTGKPVIYVGRNELMINEDNPPIAPLSTDIPSQYATIVGHMEIHGATMYNVTNVTLVTAPICKEDAATNDDINYVKPQEETNPGNDNTYSTPTYTEDKADGTSFVSGHLGQQDQTSDAEETRNAELPTDVDTTNNKSNNEIKNFDSITSCRLIVSSLPNYRFIEEANSEKEFHTELYTDSDEIVFATDLLCTNDIQANTTEISFHLHKATESPSHHIKLQEKSLWSAFKTSLSSTIRSAWSYFDTGIELINENVTIIVNSFIRQIKSQCQIFEIDEPRLPGRPGHLQGKEKIGLFMSLYVARRNTFGNQDRVQKQYRAIETFEKVRIML